MGVALRRGRECPAICVAELDRRPGKGGRDRQHYVVRHLERLPARTSYLTIATRAAEIAEAVRELGGERPRLFVDVTGCGDPVVELFREDDRIGYVVACYFNHGDQRVRDGRVVRIGKAFLVAKLQALLQARRLHLPRTEESEALAADLLDFEVCIVPNADSLAGAFPVGSRDELVTALGLAVGGGPAPPTKLLY